MGTPKVAPARRNVSATAATLTRDHNIAAPALPERAETPWHPQTEQWWADIWASPMAPEFERSDVHGLFMLAALVDAYWYEESPRGRAILAAEIRLQRQCFGLTPIDRRRLQWTIEKTEEAQDRGKRRRAKTGKPSEPPVDPRQVLRLA